MRHRIRWVLSKRHQRYLVVRAVWLRAFPIVLAFQRRKTWVAVLGLTALCRCCRDISSDRALGTLPTTLALLTQLSSVSARCSPRLHVVDSLCVLRSLHVLLMSGTLPLEFAELSTLA